MKIGDLVKWTEVHMLWTMINSQMIDRNFLTSSRERGIIVDRNSKYWFVHWINGDMVAHQSDDLEVISGS